MMCLRPASFILLYSDGKNVNKKIEFVKKKCNKSIHISEVLIPLLRHFIVQSFWYGVH